MGVPPTDLRGQVTHPQEYDVDPSQYPFQQGPSGTGMGVPPTDLRGQVTLPQGYDVDPSQYLYQQDLSGTGMGVPPTDLRGQVTHPQVCDEDLLQHPIQEGLGQGSTGFIPSFLHGEVPYPPVCDEDPLQHPLQQGLGQGSTGFIPSFLHGEVPYPPKTEEVARVTGKAPETKTKPSGQKGSPKSRGPSADSPKRHKLSPRRGTTAQRKKTEEVARVTGKAPETKTKPSGQKASSKSRKTEEAARLGPTDKAPGKKTKPSGQKASLKSRSSQGKPGDAKKQDRKDAKRLDGKVAKKQDVKKQDGKGGKKQKGKSSKKQDTENGEELDLDFNQSCYDVPASVKVYMRRLKDQEKRGGPSSAAAGLSYYGKHLIIADACGLYRPVKNEDGKPKGLAAIEKTYEEFLDFFSGKKPPKSEVFDEDPSQLQQGLSDSGRGVPASNIRYEYPWPPYPPREAHKKEPKEKKVKKKKARKQKKQKAKKTKAQEKAFYPYAHLPEDAEGQEVPDEGYAYYSRDGDLPTSLRHPPPREFQSQPFIPHLDPQEHKKGEVTGEKAYVHNLTNQSANLTNQGAHAQYFPDEEYPRHRQYFHPPPTEGKGMHDFPKEGAYGHLPDLSAEEVEEMYRREQFHRYPYSSEHRGGMPDATAKGASAHIRYAHGKEYYRRFGHERGQDYQWPGHRGRIPEATGQGPSGYPHSPHDDEYYRRRWGQSYHYPSEHRGGMHGATDKGAFAYPHYPQGEEDYRHKYAQYFHSPYPPEYRGGMPEEADEPPFPRGAEYYRQKFARFFPYTQTPENNNGEKGAQEATSEGAYALPHYPPGAKFHIHGPPFPQPGEAKSQKAAHEAVPEGTSGHSCHPPSEEHKSRPSFSHPGQPENQKTAHEATAEGTSGQASQPPGEEKKSGPSESQHKHHHCPHFQHTSGGRAHGGAYEDPHFGAGGPHYERAYRPEYECFGHQGGFEGFPYGPHFGAGGPHGPVPHYYPGQEYPEYEDSFPEPSFENPQFPPDPDEYEYVYTYGPFFAPPQPREGEDEPYENIAGEYIYYEFVPHDGQKTPDGENVVSTVTQQSIKITTIRVEVPAAEFFAQFGSFFESDPGLPSYQHSSQFSGETSDLPEPATITEVPLDVPEEEVQAADSAVIRDDDNSPVASYSAVISDKDKSPKSHASDEGNVNSAENAVPSEIIVEVSETPEIKSSAVGEAEQDSQNQIFTVEEGGESFAESTSEDDRQLSEVKGAGSKFCDSAGTPARK